MTSFNLRFVIPLIVAAGLMLVLVACGTKVELRTEAEAIAYTKSKVLSYYNQHRDKFAGDCPAFLNHARWYADKVRSDGSRRWTVTAMGGSIPLPDVRVPIAELTRRRELNLQIMGEQTFWIYDDGKVISHIAMSGLSSCSGYWGSDPNP